MSDCCHYDEGFDEGYDEGFAAGKKEGRTEAERLSELIGEGDLRHAIRAIKAGNAADAIFCLQRAFGHDTDMVEMIENEWRRK